MPNKAQAEAGQEGHRRSWQRHDLAIGWCKPSLKMREVVSWNEKDLQHAPLWTAQLLQKGLAITKWIAPDL